MHEYINNKGCLDRCDENVNNKAEPVEVNPGNIDSQRSERNQSDPYSDIHPVADGLFARMSGIVHCIYPLSDEVQERK
jgi:hypothetical protein